MPSQKPLVYLILGAAGSGRRAIAADLIEGGLGDKDRAAALLAAGEAPDPNDAKLGALARWSWTDDRIEAAAPEGASHVFLFADGRGNPVDQIEAFKPWLAANGAELARILCVVHCRLVAEHKELLTWYDACAHFADVMLLNRREGVPNKWMSDFRAHHAAQFSPRLLELVKDGCVENPALILEPEARRLSHYFDEEADEEIADAADEEDEEAVGDAAAQPEEDPWLQRRPGGHRARKLPDIAQYLA